MFLLEFVKKLLRVHYFKFFLDSNGDSFSFDVQIDTMINNNYEICLLYIEYLVQTFTTFFKRYKEMVLRPLVVKHLNKIISSIFVHIMFQEVWLISRNLLQKNE